MSAESTQRQQNVNHETNSFRTVTQCISCHRSACLYCMFPRSSSSNSMQSSSICLSVCLRDTHTHTLCFKMSSMLIQRPSACVCLPAWLSYLCTKASCTTKRCFPVKTKASSTLPPLSPVFLCLLLCLNKLCQFI